QAPHAAMPHPYFVPVIFRSSRSTHRRGVLGSAITSACRPLTVSVYVGTTISWLRLGTGHARIHPCARRSDELVVCQGRSGPRGTVGTAPWLKRPQYERFLFVMLQQADSIEVMVLRSIGDGSAHG